MQVLNVNSRIFAQNTLLWKKDHLCRRMENVGMDWKQISSVRAYNSIKMARAEQENDEKTQVQYSNFATKYGIQVCGLIRSSE